MGDNASDAVGPKPRSTSDNVQTADNYNAVFISFDHEMTNTLQYSHHLKCTSTALLQVM